MKQITLTMIVATALGAFAQGCGDPEGIRAKGSVALVVRQAGQADGSTGFNLPVGTFIDSPPGVGRGFYGRCGRSAGRWTIEITRADAIAGGLRRVVLSAPEGSAAGSVSAKFVLDSTEFSGAAECTASAVSYVGSGVRFTGACTNLRASGDLRSLDASIDLTLENCSVQ